MDHCFVVPTILVGYAALSVNFPAFGFTVIRNNGQMAISWTGQCQWCVDAEVLMTNWVEMDMVNTCQLAKHATR